ncbi:BTB/POZ domain-containing protein KCTD8 [Uranotaenia lowii]|uniref:BTB/POZ domain-containing protein KCTD8 n=1 Tax=Uranotaenia lowii TaxID=190385 RepID=UPI00247AC499|nr:BTB/POZ domain-containing protein KCTD8 [Uranotaenia lowii]XP_055587293.1 BTB/POZ domain-containing protein KCTD8 [Uranotaenia lowii]XP_055587294.1 BTB/POZ domain-containing protein KCTD8 [Uranotaenia lowii]
MDDFPAVVELNVGGTPYATALSTLRSEDGSWLQEIFGGSASGCPRDAQGRFFIDRDGTLFRYVLDYLREPAKFEMPTDFPERMRLRKEAEFYRLGGMVEAVTKDPGTITIGYRGSFQFGRDGLADVKFRKITRLLVCGRVAICREVFGDTLNESRDPDHGGPDRYTARFFLKHVFIEQAFDLLQERGFRCVGSCGSGTAGSITENLKPGVDSEENRWNHYNEFVFVRD